MATEIDAVELTIETVRKYPSVWNMALKEYKDYRVKENCWKEISQKVKMPVGRLQKKWKSLRNKYVRELKAVKKKRVTGTTSNALF